MGRLGREIIPLNCCKSLQINSTFLQAVTVLSEGKRRYLSSQHLTPLPLIWHRHYPEDVGALLGT